MSTSGSTITVKLDSEEGTKITKALAAGQRVTLLGLLARRAMNVNEITTALKSWSVTASGSFIDGVRVGDTRLADLDAGYKRPIMVRIGVEPDAVHRGGVNVLGRRFGSYPHYPTLRVRYRLGTSGQAPDAVVGLLGGELPVRSEPTV